MEMMPDCLRATTVHVQKLWTAVVPYLDTRGGVANEEGIINLAKQMHEMNLMTEKCFCLNMLRMTETSILLERFLTEGGWNILNTWLSDAKSSQNMDLILEVLKILQALPLRIEHLKANTTPKLIKYLARTPTIPQAVQSLANLLMQRWLTIIKNSPSNGNGGAKAANKKPKQVSKVKSSSTDKSGLDEKRLKSSTKAKTAETGDHDKKDKKSLSSVKRSSNDQELPTVPDKKTKVALKTNKKISISDGFMDALNSIPATAPKRQAKKKIAAKPKPTSYVPSTVVKDNVVIPSGEAADFGEDSDKAEDVVEMPAPRSPKLDKNGRPKKTVRWVAGDGLEAIRYFECEEGERVNVNSHSFKAAMQREKDMERSKFGERDDWRQPPKLDDPPFQVTVLGINSTEKKVQEEREKTVLQSLYLTPEMIPDSPAEPDAEVVEYVPPKFIPLGDDNTGYVAPESDPESRNNDDSMDTEETDDEKMQIDHPAMTPEEFQQAQAAGHVMPPMPYPPMVNPPAYFPVRGAHPPFNQMEQQWMRPNMQRMRPPMPFPPPPFRGNHWRPRQPGFRHTRPVQNRPHRADFYH